MADNSKKVSELPTASNVASTDRLLVLRSPASNASVRTVTANDFANSAKLLFANIIPNTTVISNSVSIASNGTSNVAFFSYAIDAVRTGSCEVSLHARDTTTGSTTVGRLLVVTNSSSATQAPLYAEVGSPTIDFDVDPVLSSNVMTLYFRRSGAASSNVLIRYSATLY